ncbi:hypothetical protein ACA910_006749 [Epithemia clementina (nom. ined.)]
MTPSLEPSVTPSSSPSATPSQSPSTTPSLNRSETPSSNPSSQPSEQPSSTPSTSPSLAPPTTISSVPSATPSESPTITPSSSPSESPSIDNVSAQPSEQPSTMPSESPSTNNVSAQPSEQPSTMPSESPSTNNASSQPSERPSTVPSESPSATPNPTAPRRGTVTEDDPFVFTSTFTVSDTCGTSSGVEDLRVEICLVTDVSGSFRDDLPNLQSSANAIFNAVNGAVAEARFGVATFSDYPVAPYGEPGIDIPYTLESPLSPDRDDFVNAINGLTIRRGADLPESQYDAIVGGVQGLTNDFVDAPSCGWSEDSLYTRILMLATDARFHTPADGGPHENNFTSTVAAMNAIGARFVGLIAPGGGPEPAALAAATGGAVVPLNADSSDIIDAIVGGIEELPCRVRARAVGCEPLRVSFSPPRQTVGPGETVSVTTTLSIRNAEPYIGDTITCQIEFIANGEVVLSEGVTVTIVEPSE